MGELKTKIKKPGLMSKTLSDRERAALALYVLTDCNDWKQLYLIAQPGDPDEAEQSKYLEIYISKWKNAEKVKREVDDLRRYKARIQDEAVQEDRRREEERKKGENVRQSTKPEKKPLDYSNPENRRVLYNEIIAQAGDDVKTKLDAAKVFEQIQREDRDAARERRQVVAFLPLACYDCPLYQKAKK